MKALDEDDQATAGSNTEDFLELCWVTEVRAKREPLLTLANLARCVSVARRGCPGRSATRRSLQVYASALLLCLWQDL